MLFEDLNIIEPILKSIKEAGYVEPTKIQEEAIPHIIKGRDILGCAQTGTGKTAAFAIPVLQNIFNDQKSMKSPNGIKALILAPTRELAIQIGESFTAYGSHLGIKTLVIFGGVPQISQTRALKRGVDILVATPGRLIDLVNQKFIDLRNVKYFVLDEADRMLDMGMINDVKKVIAIFPKVRQNMLFSATMPKEILSLVNSILKDPVEIEVTPVSTNIEAITQGLYYVSKRNKKHLLIDLLRDKTKSSVLVFSRTKHGANVITKDLIESGIEAQAIHGNKSQNARQLALSNFKEGKIRVLVATDIAARGIDIDEISHVINFDLPELPETYVHRIGRTGRAGKTGTALTFCDEEEKYYLKSIEKLICKEIPLMEERPYKSSPIMKPLENKNIPEKTTSPKKVVSTQNTNRNWYEKRTKNRKIL